MKTRIERTMVVFGAMAMIVLVGRHVAWSQPAPDEQKVFEDTVPDDVLATPPQPQFGTSTNVPLELAAPDIDNRWVDQDYNNSRGVEPFQLRYQQAVSAIRDAENQDAKAEATNALKVALREYFEEDISARQQELEKIAQQLKKLRDQLSIRQDKKQEIIDLQLRQAVNEAEGLGFFRGPGGAASPRSRESGGGGLF